MSEAVSPSAPTHATAGAQLKAAREAQGIHLAVLAASLKVTPRKLEALEADRVDELPDPAFARALASSVCRYLKIDAEPVLSQLPRLQSQVVGRALDHVSTGLNQPFDDRGVPTDAVEWHRFLSLPMIGAALLVLAAVAVYLVPSGWIDRLLPARGDHAGVSTTTVPVETPTAAAPEAPAPSPEVAPAPAAPASGVVDTVFSAPPVAEAPAAGEGVLGVRTSATSWIEVRDAGGHVLLSRTLTAGETVGVDGDLPLRVTIGNAEATQLVFRGQPVALEASTRDNVARLELK